MQLYSNWSLLKLIVFYFLFAERQPVNFKKRLGLERTVPRQRHRFVLQSDVRRRLQRSPQAQLPSSFFRAMVAMLLPMVTWLRNKKRRQAPDGLNYQVHRQQHLNVTSSNVGGEKRHCFFYERRKFKHPEESKQFLPIQLLSFSDIQSSLQQWFAGEWLRRDPIDT